MIGHAAQVLIPSTISFVLGIIIAPILAHYLYAHHAWKKSGGNDKGLGGGGTPIFNKLHKEREVSTPRMGGILIWAATLLTALGFAIADYFFGGVFSQLNFINRGQTWLPLSALLVGATVGFVDDMLEIRRGHGGLRLRTRLLIVTLVGLFAALWFYYKLGVSSIGIPFGGELPLSWWFIPVFVLVTLLIYAGGTIDGIDGLSGGVFSIIFMTYAGIAFVQGQFSLAAFSATIAGATLAFLWFNVPPARFYMTETGSMALTLTLSITAFSADSLGGGIGVSMLPIIAFPLVATATTTLLQVCSKKFFGKKIFRIAPIHHTFEAIGWSPAKVAMRYWIITIIMGVFGLSLALVGAGR